MDIRITCAKFILIIVRDMVQLNGLNGTADHAMETHFEPDAKKLATYAQVGNIHHFMLYLIFYSKYYDQNFSIFEYSNSITKLSYKRIYTMDRMVDLLCKLWRRRENSNSLMS